MPRVLGQIDTRKTEAILDAAVEVLAERGVHAPIEEVARRAGVSKQTIYNHYGSKTELVRTVVERRRSGLTAPLEQPGAEANPEEALAAYARAILEAVVTSASVQLLRMGVASVTEMPELAVAMYEAGPRAVRLRLAAFLSSAERAHLDIPDPDRAADVFMGMVIGGLQVRLLMGVEPDLEPAAIPARARDAAARFMRAYRA